MNLGRHVSEDAAARAYDRAAVCAPGKNAAKLNFDISDCESELELLETQTVAQLAPVLRYTPCLQKAACTHRTPPRHTRAVHSDLGACNLVVILDIRVKMPSSHRSL